MHVRGAQAQAQAVFSARARGCAARRAGDRQGGGRSAGRRTVRRAFLGARCDGDVRDGRRHARSRDCEPIERRVARRALARGGGDATRSARAGVPARRRGGARGARSRVREEEGFRAKHSRHDCSKSAPDPRGSTEVRPLRLSRRTRRPGARLVRTALDAPAVAVEARVRAGGARVARGGDAECIRPEARDRARRVSDVYGGRGGVRPGLRAGRRPAHAPARDRGLPPGPRGSGGAAGGPRRRSLRQKGRSRICGCGDGRRAGRDARRALGARGARAAREHPGRAGRRADLAHGGGDGGGGGGGGGPQEAQGVVRLPGGVDPQRRDRRRRRRRERRRRRGHRHGRRRRRARRVSDRGSLRRRGVGAHRRRRRRVRERRRRGDAAQLERRAAGFREAKRAECGGGGGARLSGRDRHAATHPGARALRALPRPEVLPLVALGSQRAAARGVRARVRV